MATLPRRGTVYVSLAYRVPSRGAGATGHGTRAATAAPFRAPSENFRVFGSVFYCLCLPFFLGFLLFERALMIQSLQYVNPLRLHCDELINSH